MTSKTKPKKSLQNLTNGLNISNTNNKETLIYDLELAEKELNYLYHNEATSLLKLNSTPNSNILTSLKSSTIAASDAIELLDCLSTSQPGVSQAAPAICYAFKYSSLQTSTAGKLNWIAIVTKLNDAARSQIIANYHHIAPTCLFLALDTDQTVKLAARKFLHACQITKIGTAYFEECFEMSSFLIDKYNKKEKFVQIFDLFVNFANYMITALSSVKERLEQFIPHFKSLFFPSIEYYKDKNVQNFCSFLQSCFKINFMTNEISKWFNQFKAKGTNISDFILILSSCKIMFESDQEKLKYPNLCRKAFQSIKSLDIFYPSYDLSAKKSVKSPIFNIVSSLFNQSLELSEIEKTMAVLINQIQSCSLLTIFHSTILENMIELLSNIIENLNSPIINRKIYNFILKDIFIGTILNYSFDGDSESFVSKNFIKKSKFLLVYLNQNTEILETLVDWESLSREILNSKSSNENLKILLTLSNLISMPSQVIEKFLNVLTNEVIQKIIENCTQSHIHCLSLLLQQESSTRKFDNCYFYLNILAFFDSSDNSTQNSMFDDIFQITKLIIVILDDEVLSKSSQIMLKRNDLSVFYGKLLISMKKEKVLLQGIESHYRQLTTISHIISFFELLSMLLTDENAQNEIQDIALNLFNALLEKLKINSIENDNFKDLPPISRSLYAIGNINYDLREYLLSVNIDFFTTLINTIFREYSLFFQYDAGFVEQLKSGMDWILCTSLPFMSIDQIPQQMSQDSFRLNCFKLAKNWVLMNAGEKTNFEQESYSKNLALREQLTSFLFTLEAATFIDKISLGFLKLALDSATDVISQFSVSNEQISTNSEADFEECIIDVLKYFKEETKKFEINLSSILSLKKLTAIWPENASEETFKAIDKIIASYLKSAVSQDFDEQMHFYINLLNMNICKFVQKYEIKNPELCHSMVWKLDSHLVTKILGEPSLCILATQILPYQFLSDVKAAPEIMDHTISEFVKPYYFENDKFTDSNFLELAAAAHLLSIYKFYTISESESIKELLRSTLSDDPGTKSILDLLLDQILHLSYSKISSSPTSLENLLNNALSEFMSMNFSIKNINSLLYAVFGFLLSVAPKMIDSYSLYLDRNTNIEFLRLVESVSPFILNSVNDDLKANDLAGLEVNFSLKNRKISARYTFESVPFDVFIVFPKLYPLKPLELGFSGMTLQNQLNEWKIWCNRLKVMLTLQKISIGKSLRTWREILDNKLLVLEQCIICFGVLHTRSKKQPDKQCSACKKIFHDDCLFKWLKTASEPTCPHCREHLTGY